MTFLGLGVQRDPDDSAHVRAMAADLDDPRSSSSWRVRLNFSGTDEAGLAPGFVHDDGNRVGKVQAAICRTHRDAQRALAFEVGKGLVTQTLTLRAEHENIATAIVDVVRAGCASTGQGKPTTAVPQHRSSSGQRRHHRDISEIVVVEPSPTQRGIVQTEPQRLHQAQLRTNVC
jgi:hypothetical protein